jgi:GAF domain-containing protein/anti-anti-sigma regulatory factor
VAVAREFTAAGAAGLGVTNRDREFRFLSDRIGCGAKAAEDPSPEIAALAGRVVVENCPLRLKSAAEHTALLGFPPDHCSGRSFLAVPVRQRDRVGGYLYVVDKQEADEFTTDDEALLQALASVTPAGADDARPDVVTGALASSASALNLLVEAARSLGAADVAAVVVPDERGWLRVASAEGQPCIGSAGQLRPTPRSVSARALRTGQTVLVPEASTDPRTCPAACSPGLEPLIAAPLITCGQSRGVLTLGRAGGGRPFDRDDSDVVTALAAHAGLLIDLAHGCPPPSRADIVGADRAGFAALLDADLQHRLVVYAATLHALLPHARRNRVLTDLLRQARELRQQLQGGAAIIREASGTPDRHLNPRESIVLDDVLDDRPAPGSAEHPINDSPHFTTGLIEVRRKVEDLIACSDIDELATHVVRDVLDDLGWLIDGGPTPQPAILETERTRTHDAPGDPGNGSAGRMHIRIDRSRRCSVIHLTGAVSLTTASAVSTAVGKELAEAPAGIVIDLADAALGDELGISVIVSVARRAERDHETRVVVAAPPAALVAPLRRVAIDVDIFDTVPTAVAALRTDRHPRTFRLRLPFGQTAGLHARRLVEHACLTWRRDHICDDALLVTTELVGNAVRHGLAPVELTITRRKRYLHIQVADSAPHPPALVGPGSVADRNGFGLVLVDTLSADWGCRQTPTGKIVWAILRTA